MLCFLTYFQHLKIYWGHFFPSHFILLISISFDGWNILLSLSVILKQLYYYHQDWYQFKCLPESSSSSQGFNLKRWTVSVIEMRQPLIFFGLPVYFKFKILFCTFTKTLGQRFDIFGSPSPRSIISINRCCSSKRVPASVILWESALSSIIYLL